MLKILYAASNNENARIQLARFIKAMVGKPFIIKVAAYKKSSPKGMSIDWTLDCLLNIFNPEHLTFDNDNLKTYFNQSCRRIENCINPVGFPLTMDVNF